MVKLFTSWKLCLRPSLSPSVQFRWFWPEAFSIAFCSCFSDANKQNHQVSCFLWALLLLFSFVKTSNLLFLKTYFEGWSAWQRQPGRVWRAATRQCGEEEPSSPGKLSSPPHRAASVVPAVLEEIQKVTRLAHVFRDLSWIDSFDQLLGKEERGFVNTLAVTEGNVIWETFSRFHSALEGSGCMCAQ